MIRPGFKFLVSTKNQPGNQLVFVIDDSVDDLVLQFSLRKSAGLVFENTRYWRVSEDYLVRASFHWHGPIDMILVPSSRNGFVDSIYCNADTFLLMVDERGLLVFGPAIGPPTFHLSKYRHDDIATIATTVSPDVCQIK